MSAKHILPELPPSERLAAAAEKIADNLGALVSLMDEIRAEVTKMNEPVGEDSEPPVLSGFCKQANHETCEGSYFQMRSGDSPDEFHCECHCHVEGKL